MYLGGEEMKRYWLIEIRAEKGLTQGEAAELCGMKQSQYSRYEVGQSKPTPINQFKIAESLGFDMKLWHENEK